MMKESSQKSEKENAKILNALREKGSRSRPRNGDGCKRFEKAYRRGSRAEVISAVKRSRACVISGKQLGA